MEPERIEIGDEVEYEGVRGVVIGIERVDGVEGLITVRYFQPNKRCYLSGSLYRSAINLVRKAGKSAVSEETKMSQDKPLAASLAQLAHMLHFLDKYAEARSVLALARRCKEHGLETWKDVEQSLGYELEDEPPSKPV
jgi:hypothetical protein